MKTLTGAFASFAFVGAVTTLEPKLARVKSYPYPVGWDAALKEIYRSDRLESLTYKHHPLLAAVDEQEGLDDRKKGTIDVG